jgi:hypothetical protein
MDNFYTLVDPYARVFYGRNDLNGPPWDEWECLGRSLVAKRSSV